MTNQVHRYPLTILEVHLDTFGHVNNATYLQILEQARWDFIHDNGYGLDEIRRTGQGPTIVEINIRFKRELLHRSEVIIESFVESYASKVGTMVQRIVNNDGDLFCEARLSIGLFDTKARRLIAPTPAWLRAVGVAPPVG